METVLNEVLGVINSINPAADLLEYRVKLAGVMARYEFKPIKLLSGHPDIAEKTKMFIAAKRLEGLSKLTLDGYALELKIFGSYVNKPIEAISTQDLRSFLGSFEHLKKSSLTRRLHVLRSFFGWLTDEEVIARDPSRKIKTPKPEKRLPKALTVEELEILRESCRTLRERALVESYYATGCRLSEIQQMNRQDIDWQDGEASVIGKGSVERIVYFSFKALYHLKKYINSRADAIPAIFITQRQPYRRLSKRGIQREIKIIAERAALSKNVHPHVFRHTLATLMLNHGADITTVQEILGHADPGTTQIYAKASNARKKEQYKKHHVI
ncbi:tyrosine recombinase XerC [Desulfocucumis palustris]|uniref:Tyrosine recombinase XerC n=1 Tax=Desulfocucumis palustris TaxID=1898651 RepID=A0A2L2XJL7_9FIRM|nr:site-specific tyrosine recombinase/integron integrase [Desulfocucumis palustris]GBF34121.1 tyrosine recombinase XerC [Desulfocucumis palustris]